MSRTAGLGGLVAATAMVSAAGLARAQEISMVPACPAGNLLDGRKPARSADTRGNLALLTDGAAANEGALWNAPPAVRFDTPAGTVTYDLGAATTLRAAAIQADANDTYGVFASADGESFHRITELPTAEGHGLRTRTVDLGGTVARFVRVGEGQGDGSYSMSEIQIFCQKPAPFPPALRVVQAPTQPVAASEAWGWNDITSARFELGLAIAGLLVVARGWWLGRQGRGHENRKGRDRLLAFLGLVSAATYVNFGAFHFPDFVHYHDTYHYYIGSKYLRELEYDRLYECTAVADWEMGLKRRAELRKITNLRTNVIEPTTDILAHPDRCKARFTADRWESFKKDIAFFRGRMSTRYYEDSQLDHGFNGTPVWAIAGSILTNTGPATHTQIVVLDAVDCALMLAMAGLIWWAFGWRVLCVALLVYATNFPSRWYWTGGSLLRYDWLFWTVAGICLTKKGRPFLGGAAIAYATLLRIFPGFIMLGPIAAAARILIKERRLDRRYLSMFGGAALAIGVLVPVSLKIAGGPHMYVRFTENTVKHASTPLVNHMGLRTLFAWRPNEMGHDLRTDRLIDPWAEWKKARLEAFRRVWLPFLLVAAVAMALLARAVQGREPWITMSLGAIMIAVGAELTSYYYAFLVAVALLHERRPGVGVVLLAVTATTGAIAAGAFGIVWNDARYTTMALVTLGGLGLILYWFAFLPEPPPDSEIPPRAAAKPLAAQAPGPAAGRPPGDGQPPDPARARGKKRRRRR